MRKIAPKIIPENKAKKICNVLYCVSLDTAEFSKA